MPDELLTEGLNPTEVGITSLFNDLIQREYELLSLYESAQITSEDQGEKRFNEIFEYIKDDINIHIGMLQAGIEDLSPSAKKVEDGKEQAAELVLDESLFEANGANKKLYALMTYSSMTDEHTAWMSYNKEKINKEFRKKVVDFLRGDSADDEEAFVNQIKDDGIFIGNEDGYIDKQVFRNIFRIDDDNSDENEQLPKGWYAEVGEETIPIEIVSEWSSRY